MILTKNKRFFEILTTGFAMFSMFFGAGNVVFPLNIGQIAKDQNLYAIIGLLITAVGVPFLGLTAMTLYNGDYKVFFARMGKKTGFILELLIMGLIGPFGAIPRCIALSYSTTSLFFPDLSIHFFSIASCVLIFLFSYNRGNIVNLLGKFLTPVLLFSLAVIIIKGIFFSPEAPESNYPSLTAFFDGLKVGYQTMDLLGAFFFSSIVIVCLRYEHHLTEKQQVRSIIIQTLKASVIGAFLLSIIYLGFSYVAAFNSLSLENVPKDLILGSIAIQILGPGAGLLACIAVALACLTTAIALSSVSAEFIHEDLTFEKSSYSFSLLITLIISYFVSTLNFTGIVAVLEPILELCYPALILLCILNILHKLYNVNVVRAPVYCVFGLSLAYFVWKQYGLYL